MYLHYTHYHYTYKFPKESNILKIIQHFFKFELKYHKIKKLNAYLFITTDN